MSHPHPFVIEGTSISLNCKEIAKSAVARAKKRGAITGSLIMNDAALEGAIVDTIDEAELIRAGKRFGRGEGGTAMLVEHGSFSGLASDVPEASMNAAQEAFYAVLGRPINDRLRDVVRAVRAIDQDLLNDCYTTIAAEGGASSCDFDRGFNAAIEICLANLDTLGARDTRIQRPAMPPVNQITLHAAE